MKKTFSIGVFVLMTIFLAGCSGPSASKSDNSDEELKRDIEKKDQDSQSLRKEDVFSRSVKNPRIALVAPDGSKLALGDSLLKFGCDDVIVFRELNGELTPKQILETMFAFQDLDDEDGWYYNVFKSSDLRVDSLDVDDKGFVRVELSGDLMTGGACDDPRVLAQIESTLTAMRIMTIENVVVFINGESVHDYLSEKD